MKTYKKLLMCGMIVLILLFSACNSVNPGDPNKDKTESDSTEPQKETDLNESDQETDSNESESNTKTVTTEQPSKSESQDTKTLTCTLISGVTEKKLLLADRDEAKVGLYFVDVNDVKNTKIFVDGESKQVSDLKNGMLIELVYSGVIAESFPAIPGNVTEIKATSPNVGEYGDLCGLYLKVLDDLWAEDPGLNHEIKNIGIDLTTAPGNLTPSEKEAIRYIFGQKLNVTAMLGTYQDFVEQGFINDKELYWKNGLLFRISNVSSLAEVEETPKTEPDSENKLTFHSSKWASGLGAIFHEDCVATWGEDGYWIGYEIGSYAISQIIKNIIV